MNKEEINKKFHCQLLHSTIPYMTDKKVWSEEDKGYVPEIIWKCKEGCDDSIK